MALESTTCGIVHHARRTRAHCPTMVSSRNTREIENKKESMNVQERKNLREILLRKNKQSDF